MGGDGEARRGGGAPRYGGDVLAAGWRRPRPVPEVPADRDLVVEEVGSGFCGAVLACEKQAGGVVVVLEDRRGRRRTFPLGPGFLLDGAPVTLVRPRPGSTTGSGGGTGGSARPAGATRTASGSRAVAPQRARVARASRIYVEGRHDAELVEKVWGADLRVEGVVVEYLSGVDDLPALVAAFGPGPGRRLGVLVDHLVPGSKEQRLAAVVAGPHVHVVGHPYVDVWAAVRPAALGIPAWPPVPRGVPWKEGVLAALGWPADVPGAWRRILAAVSGYTDLEPALVGRVEELIDFVTVA